MSIMDQPELDIVSSVLVPIKIVFILINPVSISRTYVSDSYKGCVGIPIVFTNT